MRTNPTETRIYLCGRCELMLFQRSNITQRVKGSFGIEEHHGHCAHCGTWTAYWLPVQWLIKHYGFAMLTKIVSKEPETKIYIKP